MSDQTLLTPLFARSTTAMLLLDPNFRIQSANGAACRLMGASSQSLIGQSYLDMLAESSSEAAQVDALVRRMEAAGEIHGLARIRGGEDAHLTVAHSLTRDIAPGVHLAVLIEVSPFESRANGNPGNTAATATGAIPDFEGVDQLTERELEILRLLAAGETYLTIAEKLGLSSGTVRNHCRSARQKLRAKSRSHAVAIVAAIGLIRLDQPA